MIGLDFEDIVQKIMEEKGLSEDDIRLRVKQKLTKLSGLISNEGAAHIVANELGVDLFEIVRKRGLKINKITPGMRGVGVSGKVTRLFDVRSFKKEEREGKVGSFLIGDETGILRIVLWDAGQIKLMEDGQIKQDVIVTLTNGYVRENNGYKEMHLSNRSEISLNPSGIEIGQVALGQGNGQSLTKKKINQLHQGDFVSVFATIVQAFEPHFYEACPECGKKLNDGCAEHGKTQGKFSPVFNVVLDDGTGNIRAVSFRDLANEILGVDDAKMEIIRNDPSQFEAQKNAILGKQLLITGRINKNEMFDRLEIVINKIIPADPETLSQDIVNNMNH